MASFPFLRFGKAPHLCQLTTAVLKPQLFETALPMRLELFRTRGEVRNAFSKSPATSFGTPLAVVHTKNSITPSEGVAETSEARCQDFFYAEGGCRVLSVVSRHEGPPAPLPFWTFRKDHDFVRIIVK